MSIYYTHIWNERYVVWSEWITFVLIHLKLLVAMFFPLSLAASVPMESALDEHILLLLYFICYSILFTCWAFTDEISTHGDRLTVRRYETTKTNGYKAHTCFNFLFLQKFSFLPARLLFRFPFFRCRRRRFHYMFLHFSLSFIRSLSWMISLFVCVLLDYWANACLCHFILCLHLGSEHRISKSNAVNCSERVLAYICVHTIERGKRNMITNIRTHTCTHSHPEE